MAGFCEEFLNGVLAILTLSIKYNFSISIWKCIILLGVNSLNKRDLRCHAEICCLRMSTGRRKDESEKTKRRRRKDESEKTKVKRRKRKDESEKTKAKRRKRKDDSEKTLNSGLHVFVISPSLFRYVAFVISLCRLRYFVFSLLSFRLFAFVFSLWRLRYVAAK